MMTIHRMLTFLPLLALLVWATAGDWRARRIPNWLTFSLILAGLAQSASAAGTVPLSASVLGFLTGFGLTFIMFAIGAIAGGDVKLMAGVGAWVGPGGALAVFAAAAIVGMIIVIAQALWQGRTRMLMRNSALVAVNLAYASDTGMESASDMCRSYRSVDRPLPYSVSVLSGLVLFLTKVAWAG
jgi:prepilin peptidase CpaA